MKNEGKKEGLNPPPQAEIFYVGPLNTVWLVVWFLSASTTSGQRRGTSQASDDDGAECGYRGKYRRCILVYIYFIQSVALSIISDAERKDRHFLLLFFFFLPFFLFFFFFLSAFPLFLLVTQSIHLSLFNVFWAFLIWSITSVLHSAICSCVQPTVFFWGCCWSISFPSSRSLCSLSP